MTINEMLLEMGIAPNLKGFHCLEKAIEIVKDNLNKKQYLFKYTVIYHDVAKETGTTASRVERAMRHALEAAFAKPTPKLKELFDPFIKSNRDRASVSCFIATVANYIIESEKLSDEAKTKDPNRGNRLKGLFE